MLAGEWERSLITRLGHWAAPLNTWTPFEVLNWLDGLLVKPIKQCPSGLDHRLARAYHEFEGEAARVTEVNMVEPLSQQLSDLSVHAKKAEDAVAAAQKEARDKIMARREQARAAARTATEKVNQKIKSAENTAGANWNAFKAKVAADIDGLKTMVAERKQELDAKRAENTAERLEWEAGVAVDYAIACVEQAEVAVLDAIAGRSDAEAARGRR
jgi:hypothetical protein